MINTLVNKKIMNFLLSLIKISLHNLFLMDFFSHRNGQIFQIVEFLDSLIIYHMDTSDISQSKWTIVTILV